jgi:DNA-binding transcriptional MerR regulator
MGIVSFADADHLAGFRAPPKYYKMGELAQFTGLTRQTLHNYTRWGLISEVGWTQGGHRLYDECVFGRLMRIGQLRQSHSIGQINVILNREGSSSA